MPPPEYGYMEEGDLGKPYDLGLLSRLAAHARKHLGTIALAALLILFTTGLDLLLPYLTRMAIDEHIVRQALMVNPDAAEAGLTKELESLLGSSILRDKSGGMFVPEAKWREMDQRLAERLKAAGAVSRDLWTIVDQSPAARALAKKQPDLLVAAGDLFLIPSKDLGKLSGDTLKELRAGDIKSLAVLALAFVGAASLALGLGFCQHLLLERAGQEVMFSLRQQLYAHLLSRSLAFFGKRPVGVLVTRLTNDVQNINEMYRNTVVAFCQDLFLLTGIVVVLLWLDFGLALVCLALVPLISLMAWVFSRWAREAFRAMQGHLGRINAMLSETLNGLSVVKLFRAEAKGRRGFARLNQLYYEAGMKQIKVFAVFMPLADLFSSLAVALIVWYGGGQVVQDRISLGTLVAFLFYMQMFFRPVRDMAEKYNILQSAMASAERIFNLLDSRDALPPKDESQPAFEPGRGEVRFEGVTFGYDPEKPVLKDLSFTIPPGRTWAVVGPTGAGKTSLVNLLMRFADPQEGRVLLDGRDLKQISPEELARSLALVDQDVFLLSGSLARNVTLNRAGLGARDIARALEISGAGSFVERLENGVDTELGQGAFRLSSGQRQLIAMARALAGRPRVLILDEATSSVDPASEKVIQEALPRVMAGRTSLVVAHRLSTIKNADCILVMHQGRIVEKGNHEELMQANGLYRKLVRLQEIKRSQDQGGWA